MAIILVDCTGRVKYTLFSERNADKMPLGEETKQRAIGVLRGLDATHLPMLLRSSATTSHACAAAAWHGARPTLADPCGGQVACSAGKEAQEVDPRERRGQRRLSARLKISSRPAGLPL